MRRDPRAFLLHILDASVSISNFLWGFDRSHYKNKEWLQAAVEPKFKMIGEALRQFSKLYPDVA